VCRGTEGAKEGEGGEESEAGERPAMKSGASEPAHDLSWFVGSKIQ